MYTKKSYLLIIFSLLTFFSYGQVFTGIYWVSWHMEPDYPGITSYMDHPYTLRKSYDVLQVSSAWAPVSDVAGFDALWDHAGSPEEIGRLTNGSGGDFFDLGTGNTFGSQWKAVHDGSQMYVLLKYSDINNLSHIPLSWEVMAQPVAYHYHQATYDSGFAAADTARMNMAFGRYTELGGGKALFIDGLVTEYDASIGLDGTWGTNLHSKQSLDNETHFWNTTDGITRAVLILSFGSGTSALSYPDDPYDLAGSRTGIVVGDTFAFDVKSNARIGGTGQDHRVEYFWSADRNNGYASNYYSGHITLSTQALGINRPEEPGQSSVFYYGGMLYMSGDEVVNVDVFNMAGARVKSATQVSSLSLADLENGIYLVRINQSGQFKQIIKY